MSRIPAKKGDLQPVSGSLHISDRKVPEFLHAVLIFCLIGCVLNTFYVSVNGLHAINRLKSVKSRSGGFLDHHSKSIIVKSNARLAMLGFNGVVAPLQIAGLIGCFRRKQWAHRVFAFSLIAAVLYIVFRLFTVWFVEFGPKLTNSKSGEELSFFLSCIGLGLNLFGSLAMGSFYVASYLYMRTPEVKQYINLR